MENIREAARRVMMKLNEIQPAMSNAGLEYESELVREMRQDLSVLILGEKPDPIVVEKVLDSQFLDVLGSMDHFLETLDTLGQLDRKTLRDSDKFTALLQMAMLSAENFATRSADFISSKQSFKQIFGDSHASN